MTAANLQSEGSNTSAKRELALYFPCQVFGQASAPINIALGGLIGSAMLGDDKSLATAPVTSYNVGVALGAFVATAIMRMRGRRYGFLAGSVVGAAGMVLSGLAVTLDGFWFFCLATLVNGIAGGFVQQYRFAAADRASDAFKPKAISIIMVGGVLAAIVGPQIVIHADHLMDAGTFASPFYLATALFIISFLLLLFLKPGGLKDTSDGGVGEHAPTIMTRSEIMRMPVFGVAVLCGASTYALMSFVMTGAPLAMVHHGHSHSDATLGIQWHVMAMFAPSLITGWLIASFGTSRVIATGLIILIACALVAVQGYDLMHFWGSLILLGIGWNFGFLGATAMVAASFKGPEKARAQGINDTILFTLVALASLMSGQTFHSFGWFALNFTILPVSVLCLFSLFWLSRHRAQMAS